MPKSILFAKSLTLTLAALHSFPSAIAQVPTPTQFIPLQPIAFDSTGPVIRAHSETLKPFTVAGERGVLLGQQDGTFEEWVFPVKVISHLTIEANVEGYSVPIDVNQQSAEIEVRPDRTTITYSHVAFTVRQIMLSPESGPRGTGPVVLFQFDCLHPTDFIFRFTPNLEFMWPMRNEGHPGPEWVDGFDDGKYLPGGINGFYVLHADYPDLAAAITIPDSRSGILAPYQERPQVHPVELRLRIRPDQDDGRLYPLLMAVGTDREMASTQALHATLEKLNRDIPALYQAHADRYKKLLANSVSIDTPDKSLNEAFQWAVVSIEQLKAKPWSPDSGREFKEVGRGFIPGNNDGESARALAPEVRSSETPSGAQTSSGATSNPAIETALVAGYYASGDSARPGFGWFFGRDSLYTVYAVNGYGDFALAKSELEFLIHRQRDDGKIMHEYSQTAAAIDWRAFPYMYAAADSTPLFLLATLDYVRSSGDTAFLTANRDAIEKAWDFETSHSPDAAHGGNGIYTNEQGTGWVESWPGGMPHQEIYLALLDQQASAAVAQIEDLLHDAAKSQAAKSRAESVAKTINDQFYDADKHCYAFSRNKDGSLDRTTTVYPALAWWSDLAGTTQAGTTQSDGAHSILAHPEGCLQQLSAHTLNTDWGLRDVSNEEKIYDGMSYHQGSVWPLFTGWAALAEYRGGQPLAGYQMLMENANLTKTQDLGSVTELLSGDFNVPFGRSTSHQLWSSAMVITPVLRGLFGITIDAQSKTITVNPHLPAQWEDVRVANLRVEGSPMTLYFSHSGTLLTVSISDWEHPGWKLRSDMSGAALRKDPLSSDEIMLAIPLPDVEVRTPQTAIPLPGSSTGSFRVVSERYQPHGITLTVEGLADSRADLVIIRHKLVKERLVREPGVSSEPNATGTSVALVALDTAHEDPKVPVDMQFHFPPGEGWKTITVTLTW